MACASDPAKIAENRDALERLAAAGHGPLLAALQDPRCSTRRGRPIMAAIARRLQVSPKRAAAMMLSARAMLW